ncbi:hypothetical protein GCM10008171_09390 [Methylopila jiangsuensis]|uniref:Uncharacterized protein n=1 Tax=Methylopila jiangsuensis TaxID=586230 RepID=A0A9W6N2V7_9HYPH|nr:hypothetical protein [Methylopila jiangsuensis]MDR6285928.1 hypothetical protein [Methylopila jiangsuensis]GLK75685.1 hypothetical protein GCM10008171_09390 [Methylopila jiangsuensis]
MFYVFPVQSADLDNAITVSVDPRLEATGASDGRLAAAESVDASEDVDFVDDALLNTAPHNAIERQLLTGDMVGLALMSGAILWTAMGAIA